MPSRLFILYEDISPWRADLHFEVTGPVPEGEMETLAGTFVTRVFEGQYHQMREWCVETRRSVTAAGLTPEKLYSWFPTCPKCAKAYGKNYAVLIAKVKAEPEA